MIERRRYIEAVKVSIERNPVTAILGSRQCGKTTLARQVSENSPCSYYDLENPADLARLSSPMLSLEREKNLVIIDEIQRKPEIFETLRVLSDRKDRTAKYLVLGSASPRLIKGVSESLAGRIGFVDLSGFLLEEVGIEYLDELWCRGGYPRSFLSKDEAASFAWRNDYIRTFLERDIPQLGITIPAATLRRFWTMVAHYHGQIWNAAEFARSIGSAEATARRYLDILSGAYIVRQLPPWHENIKKRQVKAPKIYIRDSGLLHTLLTITDENALRSHPKFGASWEGYCVEQIIGDVGASNAYYWRTYNGAELDLLFFKNGKRVGFEIKYTDSPTVTRSMSVALADLRLDSLFVIYPGKEAFPLSKKITAMPLRLFNKK